ncbi:hypothetical protein AOC05_17965 [Arthrobacter alpinus]|uniref:Uncharacterized protein n=1 Tax=Arthrobacter alpinus TaxID=656366 RepID=A0A0M3UGV5_9MICC|nr:hypothetical protein AOC05_00300 [Arthrobacter alpinus]ALE93775.1 hypothetical protein AOC05_17965 [Arthrobacter alpinus]
MIRLRLSILGPAVLLIAVLGVLALMVPDLVQPLITGMFIVMVAAFVIVFLLERSRRHRGR